MYKLKDFLVYTAVIAVALALTASIVIIFIKLLAIEF